MQLSTSMLTDTLNKLAKTSVGLGVGTEVSEAVGGLTSNASGTLPRLELYGRAPSQHGQSGSYSTWKLVLVVWS